MVNKRAEKYAKKHPCYAMLIEKPKEFDTSLFTKEHKQKRNLIYEIESFYRLKKIRELNIQLFNIKNGVF